MSNEETRRASEAMVQFESSLEALVLEAFARGAKIEGDWYIDTGATGAPCWLVTVSKVEADDVGYDSSLIED